MPGILVGAKYDSCMPHAAWINRVIVWKQLLVADNSYGVVTNYWFEKGLKPAFLHLGVIVEKYDVVCAGSPAPPIRSTRKKQILPITDVANLRNKASDIFRRSIG